MAKKRRGRKMPGWRKAIRAAVGIAGKGIGLTVALGPAISSIMDNMSTPAEIPPTVLARYTGFNLNTGTFTPTRTMTGIGSIVGGILIMKLFSYLARSV